MIRICALALSFVSLVACSSGTGGGASQSGSSTATGTEIASTGTNTSQSEAQTATSDGAVVFLDQSIAGVFGGVAWSAVAARFEEPKVDAAEDAEWNLVLISNAKTNICEDFLLRGDDTKRLMVALPLKVGRRDFKIFSAGGDNIGGNFASTENGKAQNKIATKGAIELANITSTSVDVKLVANFDAANAVNGKITATRCCRKTSVKFELCQ